MDGTYMSSVLKSDVPETVLRDMRLLYEQERRIAELEAELTELRNNYANLKQNLEPYFANLPPTSVVGKTEETSSQAPIPPIHQCPDEVLYLIFDQYLSISTNHRSIRLLLLVCKRFRNLVMGKAKLWARIEIYDSRNLLHLSDQKSLRLYVSACVSRSGNLPLSVYLDMSHLDRNEFIIVQLYEFAKRITNRSEHPYVYDTISGQDWDFSSDLFETQVERAFDCLFGPNGNHVKRWNDLNIAFPENEWAADIWKRLRRYLHNLASLTVSWFPDDHNINPLPSPLCLKHLEFHSNFIVDGTPAIFSDISSRALEYLRIEASHTLGNLTEVSRFTQLRRLDIDCLNSTFQKIDPSAAPVHSIHLPLLKSLRLSGFYDVLSRQQFEFPSLELLTIEYWGTHSRLGGLSPRHIQWLNVSSLKEKSEVAPIIRDFILLSNSLHVFSVQESERNVAEDVIAQCKAQGNAQALSQLVIEYYKGNELKRIDL